MPKWLGLCAALGRCGGLYAAARGGIDFYYFFIQNVLAIVLLALTASTSDFLYKLYLNHAKYLIDWYTVKLLFSNFYFSILCRRKKALEAV
jgi:hypothetical protein